MQRTIARRVTAEAVGTCLLLAAVVGSGIMGERLAGGNVAVALLANTIATGAALVALILTFGPISGAHFNPAVTLADASQGGLPWEEVPLYLGAQVIGAFAGVAAAHLMFEMPVFFASRHIRSGPAQAFSEFVATFGLLAVIWGCAPRLRGPGRTAVGGRSALPRRSGDRRVRRRGGRTPHVRDAGVLRIPAHSLGTGASLQRIRGDLRAARGDLGLCTAPYHRGAVRGRLV